MVETYLPLKEKLSLGGCAINTLWLIKTDGTFIVGSAANYTINITPEKNDVKTSIGLFTKKSLALKEKKLTIEESYPSAVYNDRKLLNFTFCFGNSDAYVKRHVPLSVEVWLDYQTVRFPGLLTEKQVDALNSEANAKILKRAGPSLEDLARVLTKLRKLGEDDFSDNKTKYGFEFNEYVQAKSTLSEIVKSRNEIWNAAGIFVDVSLMINNETVKKMIDQAREKKAILESQRKS